MLTNIGRAVSTVQAGRQLWQDYNAVQGYLLTGVDASVPLVNFSGVMSIEYRREGEVVSVPIEQGSFSSYNKVKAPDSIKAQLAIMGTDDELQREIDMLQALQQGTKLVNFVTPVQEYRNLSLESFNFMQTAQNGLGILYVDIELVEVKTVEPQYVQKNKISGKGAKNGSDVSTVKQGQKSTSVMSDGFSAVKKAFSRS